MIHKIDTATLKKTRAQFQLYPLSPDEFPEKAVACSAAAFNGLLYMAANLDDPGKSYHRMCMLTHIKYNRGKCRRTPLCPALLSWTWWKGYLCHNCEHSASVPQHSGSQREKHDVNAICVARYVIFQAYIFNSSYLLFRSWESLPDIPLSPSKWYYICLFFYLLFVGKVRAAALKSNTSTSKSPKKASGKTYPTKYWSFYI